MKHIRMVKRDAITETQFTNSVMRYRVFTIQPIGVDGEVIAAESYVGNKEWIPAEWMKGKKLSTVRNLLAKRKMHLNSEEPTPWCRSWSDKTLYTVRD